MREALSVDQVQKIVAKPTARPSSARPISWSPSFAGSAISSRAMASSASSLGSTS
jgi:hypothetical protein